MKIIQIYTGCLAQGAYYIESNGEVAIIDPLREVEDYIDRASKDNAKIKYIFETHFHADFVSGHVTLADKTGADIIYGPNASTLFKSTIALDGQVFKVGDITITALHTPGHTMESTTYLLKDATGKDHAIFTGDTLFLGDVGRPDLAQKMGSITTEDLAGLLYDSLRTKIMPLADDVIVYPAHGAGSACGKNMMKKTVDTLGNQKKMNYALRVDMTKEEFIIAANETDAVMLDVRHQNDFVAGHVPRSIFIGLNGSFAPWVGALIKDVNQPILLIVEDGKLEETIIRLSRVGFDNVLGYLKGGIVAWKKAGLEIDTIASIPASALQDALTSNPEAKVVDVRKESEYHSEHILSAENFPLSNINNHLSDLPTENDFFIHCAGGYRSVIASSILKSRGIHNLIDIAGGYKAIKETDIQVTDFVCPSTL